MKEKLIVASGNENKIREIKNLLGHLYDICSMKEAGLSEDIQETGSTFEENALIKAQYVMDHTGYAAIADDSGLEVDALGGAPGVYSARYSGQHGNDMANNRLLLKNLENVSCPRKARYVAAIALTRPGKAPIVRRGICEGEILTYYKGTGGFGYDPLFLCELGKTFAELTMDEKNRISHRKRGIEAVLNALKVGELI